MENLNRTPLIKNSFCFSSFFQTFIQKTSDFCRQVLEVQKTQAKNEKKLSLYEKFHGLNRLSFADLEKLEKHFSRGLDLVKEERIKKKYQKQIADLQARLGEPCETILNQSMYSGSKHQDGPEEALAAMSNELMKFVEMFETCDKGMTGFVSMRGTEQALQTVKRTTTVPNHAFILEETPKEQTQTPTSSSVNENLFINTQPEELVLFKNLLNSKTMECEVKNKASECTIRLHKDEPMREHSPDFSFHSQAFGKKSELKSMRDIEAGKQKKKQHRSAVSISGIPFADSLDFSFDEEARKEDQKRNMMKSSMVLSRDCRENVYLKKLKREMGGK